MLENLRTRSLRTRTLALKTLPSFLRGNRLPGNRRQSNSPTAHVVGKRLGFRLTRTRHHRKQLAKLTSRAGKYWQMDWTGFSSSYSWHWSLWQRLFYSPPLLTNVNSGYEFSLGFVDECIFAFLSCFDTEMGSVFDIVSCERHWPIFYLTEKFVSSFRRINSLRRWCVQNVYDLEKWTVFYITGFIYTFLPRISNGLIGQKSVLV